MAITKATAQAVAPAAKGDLVVGSATNDASVLGVGTDGQVLTADSSTSTGLKWATAGSTVVQIVAATYATTVTSTSTTYAATGLSVNITPTSASNKILVMVTQNGITKNTTDNGLGLKLRRGTTDIVFMGLQIARENGGISHPATASTIYLDSPATTSTITYNTQFNNNTPSGTVFVQNNGALSSIVAMEVVA